MDAQAGGRRPERNARHDTRRAARCTARNEKHTTNPELGPVSIAVDSVAADPRSHLGKIVNAHTSVSKKYGPGARGGRGSVRPAGRAARLPRAFFSIFARGVLVVSRLRLPSSALFRRASPCPCPSLALDCDFRRVFGQRWIYNTVCVYRSTCAVWSRRDGCPCLGCLHGSRRSRSTSAGVAYSRESVCGVAPVRTRTHPLAGAARVWLWPWLNLRPSMNAVYDSAHRASDGVLRLAGVDACDNTAREKTINHGQLLLPIRAEAPSYRLGGVVRPL